MTPTEVLSDLYNTRDTKVWVDVDGSVLGLIQGRDKIFLPRDAFARFTDEVNAIIDAEREAAS